MTEPPPHQPPAIRTVLVTGGARRLGRAIALGLAEDGFDVALHYHHSADEIEVLKREVEAKGRQATTIPADLQDPTSAASIIEAARAALGPVSLLVNNASLFERDDLAGMTLESWRRLTDINLSSPVFLMQAFAAQPDLPAAASIINMLDQQNSAPSPKFFSYATAKIGLEGATKLAAFELAPKIRVNGIAPGLVLRSGNQTDATFLSYQRKMPMHEGLGADDIIRAVRYLIASPFVTGEVLTVDSGQALIGPGNSHLSPNTEP